MVSKESSAAAALADLFFDTSDRVSDAEKSRANELRRTYREWREPGKPAAPPADVLDLNHLAETREQRSLTKMKRVKTVGARLQEVRALPAASCPPRPTQRAPPNLHPLVAAVPLPLTDAYAAATPLLSLCRRAMAARCPSVRLSLARARSLSSNGEAPLARAPMGIRFAPDLLPVAAA